ncbi:MAG: 4Fe-4S ferredoxin [Raoultibacter sp.]
MTDEKSNIGSLPEEKPSSPEAKVLVLRDYCIRHKGADCERCALACPHDAITFTDDNLPQIDTERCTSCGICFGICDAFSSNKVTLLDLHERVKHIARMGDKVYFTCPENVFPGFVPASNVIVLPCLACMPPELWALILAENITVIIGCDLTYCIDCERAGSFAESFYKHTTKTAEDWTSKQLRLSKTIPEKKNIVKDIANPTGVARRSALTNLVDDVSDIVTGKRRLRNSEVLQNYFDKREKSRAIAQLKLSEVEEINRFAPLGHMKKTMFPKRRMLLEALNLDPSIAEKVPLYLAEIEDPQSEELRSCVSLCPTGALFPNPETGEISIEQRYCIACGICIDSVSPGVISLIETDASIFLDPSEEETNTISDDANKG